MDVDATITLSYTATADCAKSWKAASGFTNTYVPGLVAIDASDTITLEAELVDDTEGITWSNSCGLATEFTLEADVDKCCLLYTSPSPRDRQKSRMPSSA